MTQWDPNTNGFYLTVNWVWFIESKKWVRFIESQKFNSNQENIAVYEVNLDIFSIAIDFFAFNEPGSGHRLSIHNYLTPSLRSQTITVGWGEFMTIGQKFHPYKLYVERVTRVFKVFIGGSIITNLFYVVNLYTCKPW